MVGVIRVVSWNVLADAYVRRDYYPRTPPALLDPATRRRAIVERLATYATVDVVCLQEVDTALFRLAVETLPDSTPRHLPKRGRSEGCAILVHRNASATPGYEELVFSDASGHVALAATFAGLTVVTTHLKWEPETTAPEIHRGRSQLAEILDRWPSGPRIVCGDFNAEPDSAVLALASARGLADAYGSASDAFTCNANARRQRIDFILHSSELVATPSPLHLHLEDDTPLPGAGEPSDHLAIEARINRRI
jgi:endonuclease/exonuclease/phosphatase family metal-dependent hydrolase